jgi:predicted nucleic acid-binding protein
MDSDDRKRLIAQNILSAMPSINTQVLTEVANVCKRKFRYNKEATIKLWNFLLADCSFVQTNKSTFQSSIQLVEKYDFQLYDSLVVASALESGCKILYSEDMHHKLIVERKLTIINPFL